MTRLCFFLLAALVCGEVFAEARIDSRTPESFNRTLAQMMRELPPRKAAELNTAIASLPFAGMTSVKDTPADGVVKLDLKKIDGMTADAAKSMQGAAANLNGSEWTWVARRSESNEGKKK